MKIVILSRLFAEKIVPEVTIPHAVISITSPAESKPPEFQINEFTKAVLRLECYDLDEPDLNDKDRNEVLAHYGHGIFNDAQAEQVVAFIMKMKDMVKAIICHCDAGISRSSGVGAAISLILNGSDQKIFNDRRYLPNMFIYRKILDQYYKTTNT